MLFFWDVNKYFFFVLFLACKGFLSIRHKGSEVMAWQEVATFPCGDSDSDPTRFVCRRHVVRFCEEQGICVKTKTGRAAADGSRALVIYAYCKTHEACGHVQRHDFVRSDGGWLHKIYCKGQHEEVVRAVRRRPAGDSKRRIVEELTS